jgi:RNA-directed DNA polymerase
MIPKPGSNGKRPLGIPTVRDRVVQAALLRELEPVFEPSFADNSYGFRPGRSAKGALSRSEALIKAGFGFVVEADIEKYFDTIPHDPLLDLVRAVVDEEPVIDIVRAFLEAGVMEQQDVLRMPELGTPQGGVISPLLANIYLNPLDQLMVAQGYELLRYADDFVIMCRSRNEAEAALEMVKKWMRSAHLALHPDKTGIVDTNGPAGFDFLGYHLSGERRCPREKSILKLKNAISDMMKRRRPGNLPQIIRQVNEVLKGWLEYFRHSTEPFHDLDGWVAGRLRSLMRTRNPVGKELALRYWPDAWFRGQGLFSLEEAHRRASRGWQ